MNDALLAHFRLAAQLSEQRKVRTHEWVPPAPKKHKPLTAIGTGSGGHNRRTVIIGKRRFAGVNEAKKRLHIGTKRWRAMVESGEVRYED